MSFITEWISQIVFFIFIATFISLLVPSTKHDKVIKLVFGLVIFLLFLHPITELFNINPNQYVESWEVSMEEMLGSDLEDEINSKKSEIQDSQHAYILEQLQLEINQLVEQDLKEEYNVSLKSVDLQVDESIESENISADDIEMLTFHLEEEMDNQIEEVEIVSIPSKNRQQNHEDEASIKKMIATKLNVAENQIQLVWEGE
ncbi:stage III sporulation protein AF [Piscibacillus halophilus]|uniref:Stage III sporulation protein AF n=1 Tax=Piscibacillus halophilus TaxID=571933 RepID=A0A1H9A9Y8_9BACI|nr:stage III sporulation protein AF [Piscibacillus halophilus]SEP73253.1 stage III sporulation protein AF [Piscibacillus halophilus]